MEGNLRFKIDWASLIVGWKFTVFALFCYVFEGNFQVQAPRGLIYIKGRFNEGSFCVTSLRGLYLEGLIHGGDITSRMKDQQLQHVSSVFIVRLESLPQSILHLIILLYRAFKEFKIKG